MPVELHHASADARIPGMARRATGSGVTTVRMPVAMHVALIARAEAERVSLNTLLVALLAGAIEFSLEEEAAK